MRSVAHFAQRTNTQTCYSGGFGCFGEVDDDDDEFIQPFRGIQRRERGEVKCVQFRVPLCLSLVQPHTELERMGYVILS